MPEMTGEIAKGRSMRVRRTLLAGELEAGDRPGGGEAEDEVGGDGDRRR